MKVVLIYERSDLIRRAVQNARSTLFEVIATVVLVILLFLWHPPSAAIPVLTIPVAILLAFVPLRYFGVSINVMSLAGIAIACGALVDAAIILLEQVHKKLESHERAGRAYSVDDVVLQAVREVAGPTFLALLS